MKEFTYTVTDPLGIHARPANELVQTAAKFKSVSMLYRGEKSVNLRGLFKLMNMAVKQGQEVRITCEGEDENEAAAALEALMREKL